MKKPKDYIIIEKKGKAVDADTSKKMDKMFKEFDPASTVRKVPGNQFQLKVEAPNVWGTIFCIIRHAEVENFAVIENTINSQKTSSLALLY